MKNKRGIEEIKQEIKKDFYLNNGKNLKNYLIEIKENWGVNLSLNILCELLNIKTYYKAKKLNSLLETFGIDKYKTYFSKNEIKNSYVYSEKKDFSLMGLKNLGGFYAIRQEKREIQKPIFILRV